MAFVPVKEMIDHALKMGYAVGHFDVHNLEWMQAVLEAAEEERAPAIIGVTEDAVRYFGGYSVAVTLAASLLHEMNITIPVALHLDHGSSVESCIAAIDAGFSSVMIDASHHPFEENVKIVSEVVAYAHPKGVTVEAELGRIGGQEGNVTSNQPIYADQQECEELTMRTKIDSLAPALGSAHGLYKGEPKLDFDKMKSISESIRIPLVLHGASGIPPELIKKAISLGTAKINVNADNHLAFTKVIRDCLDSDKALYNAADYLAAGRQAVKQAVIEKIKLFGSSNMG